jgi:hypothetical protein
MQPKHTKKNKSKRKRTSGDNYLETKLQESIKSVPITESIDADIQQKKTRKRYNTKIYQHFCIFYINFTYKIDDKSRLLAIIYISIQYK